MLIRTHHLMIQLPLFATYQSERVIYLDQYILATSLVSAGGMEGLCFNMTAHVLCVNYKKENVFSWANPTKKFYMIFI